MTAFEKFEAQAARHRMIPTDADRRDYRRFAAFMGWNLMPTELLGGMLHHLFHYYAMRLKADQPNA